MDPRGAPVVISSQELYEFSMTVLCFLFFKQLKMNFSKSPEKQYALSFASETMVYSIEYFRDIHEYCTNFLFLIERVSSRFYHMR